MFDALPKKNTPSFPPQKNKQNPLNTELSHLTTGTLEGASLRLKRLARPRPGPTRGIACRRVWGVLAFFSDGGGRFPRETHDLS